MAKTGRKPHADPPENWRLSIPRSLAIQVELLLYDPAKGKVAYSSRSDYVTSLIRHDLNQRKGIQP